MSPLVSYLGVRVRVLGFILKVLVLFCLPRVYAFAFLGFFPYPAPFISCELVCFFVFTPPIYLWYFFWVSLGSCLPLMWFLVYFAFVLCLVVLLPLPPSLFLLCVCHVIFVFFDIFVCLLIFLLQAILLCGLVPVSFIVCLAFWLHFLIFLFSFVFCHVFFCVFLLISFCCVASVLLVSIVLFFFF